MMYALYTAAMLVALVLFYAPVAVLRRLGRGVPLNARARLGLGGALWRARTRPGWLHAVSVGEAIAAGPLVDGLRRLCLERPLVVTTVTETGARVVRERYAGLAIHRFFPLDLPGATRRFVAAVDPAFLVCLETELWPNMLRTLAARDIPVMIANGRISDRAYRRYRLLGGFMGSVLAEVRVFAMQSDEDARRIIALGVSPERVVVTGNIKNEALPDTAGSADLWRRLLGFGPNRRGWIAGSTHRGEEEVVLDAHRAALRECPELALVIAPRHPERAQEIVFVGRCVGRLRGRNVLEPAVRRKPVLRGPHAQNFRESAALLESAGAAVVVRDAADLGRELTRLLSDGDLRVKLGEAGREAVASRHGAVRETLELVSRFLIPGDHP